MKKRSHKMKAKKAPVELTNNDLVGAIRDFLKGYAAERRIAVAFEVACAEYQQAPTKSYAITKEVKDAIGDLGITTSPTGPANILGWG
jgi:hypothetical protein